MNQSAVKGVVTASAFCGSTYPVPLWFFLLLKMNQKTVIEMLKKTIEPKTIQTIATVDKGITPKISSFNQNPSSRICSFIFYDNIFPS